MADSDRKYSEEYRAHKFKPGQSGNPTGRPKGVKYLSEAYAKVLSQVAVEGKEKPDKAFEHVLHELTRKGATMAEFVALAILRKGMKGEVRAASEMADRTEGKAPQHHKITGPQGGALQVENYDFAKLPPDELRELVRLLSKVRPEKKEEGEEDGV